MVTTKLHILRDELIQIAICLLCKDDAKNTLFSLFKQAEKPSRIFIPEYYVSQVWCCLKHQSQFISYG